MPYLFRQFESNPNIREFSNFNEAADEFFSKLLAQKVEQQIQQHETTVERKLEKVREDHSKRIQGLEAQVEKWNHFAQLIEQNVEAVCFPYYTAQMDTNQLILFRWTSALKQFAFHWLTK